MSIRYGISNSDRLVIAAATNINDLKAWTNIGWFRPTTFGAFRIWSKQSTSLQRHAGLISGTSGFLNHDVQRATTDGSLTTSTALIIDRWQCIAFTYDEADGPRVFIGSQDRPMEEALYSSRTVGTGATEADAANPLYFANRDTNASAFVGQIDVQAHFARRLGLDEMQEWADNPYPIGAAVHIIHGQNGVGTQIDLSGNGNHGTITGPTVTSLDRIPLATVRRRRWWASVAAQGLKARSLIVSQSVNRSATY